MLIETRRGDPGAITAGLGQTAMSPRHPGRGELAFGQALEQGGIGARRRQIGQRRHMPGAADHGNALKPFLLRRTQLCAHRRLALLFEQFRRLFGISSGTQRAHQLADRLKQLAAVLAQFNLMFPPAFAIAITGRFRDPAQRIAAQFGPLWASRRRRGIRRLCDRLDCFHLISAIGSRFRHSRCCRVDLQRQAHRLRQVHEAHRHALLQAIADCLPFRGKAGEGVIDGVARFAGIVQQQRHRRPQVRINHQRQQILGIGWSFHQDQIRLQRCQRRQHAACRTGAMMADTEQRRRGGLGHGRGLRRGRGRRDTDPSSRRAP